MLAGFCVFGAFLLALSIHVDGYEVQMSDSDDAPQICSGMWGGEHASINITFQPSSVGQVAAVIYEWKDEPYLGVTVPGDTTFPKLYVCTSDAVKAGFCNNDHLGQFIFNLPQGKAINDTSFWTARIGFKNITHSVKSEEHQASGFWDNPDGSPILPESADDKYNSPWRLKIRQSIPFVNDILWYSSPISYPVRHKGYYCVALLPVTILASPPPARQTQEAAIHSTYQGIVLFHNTFEGKLPASDFPKVQFYLVLLLVYISLGSVWAFVCWKHRDNLLPIQYYLSSLSGFLVLEMLSSWAYYRYLNSHGSGTIATVFLFVVAIMDAGRNSLSLFLLLIVSLGLSVVKESLGPLMTRCWLLAIAHFVFGVLYAVGIVELELQSTSGLVLLLFIVPLAFTLSGFLSWIMYALNGTIQQLQNRKQHYKLHMFRRLYYILLITVAILGIFFVVSSMSFSNRLNQDYAAETWETRWWLLDGWLTLLYLAIFVSIAYIWRPTDHNRRLAMSDELAQDEDEAAEYDLETMRADDDETLVEGRGAGAGSYIRGMHSEEVVFEIGDDELNGPEEERKKRARNSDDEQHALMPSQHLHG